MSLQGVDDMEIVRQFGLSPESAYTPAINDEAIEAMVKDNLSASLEQALKAGATIQEATKIAKADARDGRKQAETMLKKVQSKRGYK